MKLILLKLGGSLLTDKRRPRAARTELIKNLAHELAANYQKDPDLKLVIGTGAGSFGHYEASKHSLNTAYGIARIGMAAQELNALVLQAMLEANVPATALHASSFLTMDNGEITDVPLNSLIGHLEYGLIPVLHGDVVIDSTNGAKILSTEALFDALTHGLTGAGHTVDRVIYGTIVDGVLDQEGKTIPKITPANIAEIEQHFYTPPGFDVTGGMKLKVNSSLELAKLGPTVQIVDLQPKGALIEVLAGGTAGTRISV